MSAPIRSRGRTRAGEIRGTARPALTVVCDPKSRGPWLPVADATMARPTVWLAARYRTLTDREDDTLPATITDALVSRWLRDVPDACRLQRYLNRYTDGAVSTLTAARHDPDARLLLGPATLVLLERLDADPDELLAAWPDDQPLGPLYALAEVNARPLV